MLHLRSTKNTHFIQVKQIPPFAQKRYYPHMGDSFHFLDSSRQQAEAQYIFLIHPQEITISLNLYRIIVIFYIPSKSESS